MLGLDLIYVNKRGPRCQTGDMPLREPMLTQFTDAYIVHQAWIVYNPCNLKLVVLFGGRCYSNTV